MGLDVVEFEPSAWVRLMTTNDTWRQDSAVLLNIRQGDVVYIDQRLSGAISSKRIEHTSGTTTIGFFLLLRTDVDRPPDRVVNLQVLVVNVGDFAAGAGKHGRGSSRVSLDVDGLEGVVELVITEGNIVHTVVGIIGRDASDGHSNSKPDIAVSDNHILCALRNLVVAIARFDSDGIIIISDVESLNENVAAVRVNTVSVEWEHGQGHTIDVVEEAVLAEESFTVEKLAELDLSLVVNPEFEIMHIELVNVLQHEMETRGVDPSDTRELKVLTTIDAEELRSAVRDLLDELTEPPHVALTINGTLTLNSEAVDVRKGEHVSDFAFFDHGVLVVALGQFDSAVDLQSDVLDA